MARHEEAAAWVSKAEDGADMSAPQRSLRLPVVVTLSLVHRPFSALMAARVQPVGNSWKDSNDFLGRKSHWLGTEYSLGISLDGTWVKNRVQHHNGLNYQTFFLSLTKIHATLRI